MRTGGPADFLFEPSDACHLTRILAAIPPDMKVTVLGGCSNVLIRDKGIRGAVIRLGSGFRGIRHDQASGTVTAGAAVMDREIARWAAASGTQGLEFLSGIPGSLGGSLRTNAGAYGREISDVLISASGLDRNGHVHILNPRDFAFSYRHSNMPNGLVITEVTLKADPGDREEIHSRMQQIMQAREKTQPVRARTGGSTFKNPPGHRAWELIDSVGGRGLRHGDARISDHHCNFLINTGNASAQDIENLGEEVRRRVREQRGIDLEWEIQIVGEA